MGPPVGRRARGVASDAALVGAVAVLLAGLHYLVPSARAALAFRHDLSAPWTLFTAAYVHASGPHLAHNLLGYLLAASYACALCFGADERLWFRRTVAVLLFVLPPLVNLGSYAVFAVRYPGVEVVSRGFSGVVGGFAGFLLVAVYAFVRRRYDARVGRAVGLSAFLSLLLAVDSRYAGGVRLVVVGPAVVGVLLLIGDVVAERGLPARPRAAVRSAATDVVAVGLVCVVLAVLTLGLFPAPGDVVRDGSFTNVFAHATGLLLGVALSGGLLFRTAHRGLSARDRRADGRRRRRTGP